MESASNTGEAAAAMGDMLRTERENHAVTKAQLENALDRLDKLGENTEGAREQTHLKFPREDYGLPRPVTPGHWLADSWMSRIVLANDKSTPVAHFKGVRKVDMELMAMAPELAHEVKNCTRILLRVALQSQNSDLIQYASFLEGDMGLELHRLGVKS